MAPLRRCAYRCCSTRVVVHPERVLPSASAQVAASAARASWPVPRSVRTQVAPGAMTTRRTRQRSPGSMPCRNLRVRRARRRSLKVCSRCSPPASGLACDDGVVCWPLPMATRAEDCWSWTMGSLFARVGPLWLCPQETNGVASDPTARAIATTRPALRTFPVSAAARSWITILAPCTPSHIASMSCSDRSVRTSWLRRFVALRTTFLRVDRGWK